MSAAKWQREPIAGEGQSPPVPALPSGHRLHKASSLVDASGEIKLQWLKTTAIGETPEELLARLLDEIPARVPSRGDALPAPTGPLDDDVLAVYPMGDPHIGMLAWGVESGADFDLQIAEDLMVRAIRDLVSRGPRSYLALLINLGDFFHYDNDNSRTTKGDHTLDVDGRAAKVLVVGLRIMVATIDALLEHHARVEVRNKIGNHDGHTALMLAIALAAHYRDEPRVSIPIEPQHRTYFHWGRNLIGMTHGDRARADDLGEIMAAEQPKAWGASEHRHWYCGHVHHSTVKEYRGCRVETFRTLAARDSWHARQGYQSGRDMHRITLHREHGEIGREVASVSWLLRDAKAAAPVQPAPPSMTPGHAPHLDGGYAPEMHAFGKFAADAPQCGKCQRPECARCFPPRAADVSGLDFDDVPATRADTTVRQGEITNVDAAAELGRSEWYVRDWRRKHDGATARDCLRAHGVTA